MLKQVIYEVTTGTFVNLALSEVGSVGAMLRELMCRHATSEEQGRSGTTLVSYQVGSVVT